MKEYLFIGGQEDGEKHEVTGGIGVIKVTKEGVGEEYGISTTIPIQKINYHKRYIRYEDCGRKEGTSIFVKEGMHPLHATDRAIALLTKKTISLVACVDGHRDLWGRIAEARTKLKAEVATPSERKLRNTCYACEFVGLTGEGFVACGKCPFDWGANHCSSPGTPFHKWDDSRYGHKDPTIWAREVRDIPLKPWAQKEYDRAKKGEMMDKPTLGVQPKKFWLKGRVGVLLEALKRYMNDGKFGDPKVEKLVEELEDLYLEFHAMEENEV